LQKDVAEIGQSICRWQC